MSPSTTTERDTSRPRIAGEREEEILDAAVSLLLEVGYDRVTMDAVALRAKASKATLYRRWDSKQALVVDAVIRSKRAAQTAAPDTGSLRGDLIATFCSGHGHATGESTRILAAVLTAVHTDADFGHAFRTRFLAPKLEVMRGIYERAAARGELAPGLDVSLVGPALAGIILHRTYVLGEDITPDLVTRVVDQIILPAATGRPSLRHHQENA